MYTLVIVYWNLKGVPVRVQILFDVLVIICILGPRLMPNLREAYHKPFEEEARGHFSEELEFHQEPMESEMSVEEDVDVSDIAHGESTVSSRSDLP
jgi:hypothetical protein